MTDDLRALNELSSSIARELMDAASPQIAIVVATKVVALICDNTGRLPGEQTPADFARECLEKWLIAGKVQGTG